MNRREFLGATATGLLSLAGCSRKEPAQQVLARPIYTSIVDPVAASTSKMVTAKPMRFTDVTREAGIHWAQSDGETGHHLYISPNGGGVAFFDYNNDGLLDIFAPQGGPIPGDQYSAGKFPTRNVLYRNNGDGTFTDVTAGSGLDAYTNYGQGVSIADYNNDGWPDIYITSFGGSKLFRNNGNGTFTDVTDQAGVADIATELPWPLSSAWADYDNDGHLDLFICHYVRWSVAMNKICRGRDGSVNYCSPQVFDPSVSRLYHNNGDGTFTDVTQKSGIGKLLGKSMGVAWIDYDDDGWMDLFVTNDTITNFLLHNNRDGTFTEVGIAAGVALGNDSTPMAAMGIGIGDYDNDGREDLFVINFAQQPKSVYRNAGGGLFLDNSGVANVASTNQAYIGFSVESFDYDLDGHKDLIYGNGHVLDAREAISKGSTYEQSQQLFHNQHDGTFIEDQRSLGDLVHPRVTRGMAIGDFDNDGDLDVALMGVNEPLQLFRNDGGNQNGWITLRLEGTKANRDAIGSKVVISANGKKQTQWVRGGSSFCSHSDIRITFGLGDLKGIDSLEVRWSRGRKQKFGPLPGNAFYWVREGDQPVPDPKVKRKG